MRSNHLISYYYQLQLPIGDKSYDLSCKIKQAVTHEKEGSWFEAIYSHVSKT